MSFGDLGGGSVVRLADFGHRIGELLQLRQYFIVGFGAAAAFRQRVLYVVASA